MTQSVSIVASVIFLSHPAHKEVYTRDKSGIILFWHSDFSQDLSNIVAGIIRDK